MAKIQGQRVKMRALIRKGMNRQKAAVFATAVMGRPLPLIQTGVNLMTKKKTIDTKEDYPLQVYVISYPGDEALCFKSREEAFGAAEEDMEESGDNTIIVGTYTLSGLKRLSKKVIEEDV